MLGEQHQLAGWAPFDAGNHEQARLHYRASFYAARDAGDGALAGNALAFLAYQATTTAKDGTATATESHETARTVATPRDKALYLTWLASSLGQAREVEASAETLARAYGLAAGVASVRPLTRITSVARKLVRHRAVPDVTDVLDRIGLIDPDH